MTKELRKHLQFDPDMGEVFAAENRFTATADEFVAAARGQGVELTGPNGPEHPRNDLRRLPRI